MKFAKIAKDTTGRVLEEGDILLYQNDKGNSTTGVIDKILQRSRDQFPNVQVKTVTTDWRGANIKVQRSTIAVEAYKIGRVVQPGALRDDVPSNTKIKEIQQEIMAKTPNKIRR
jgi:hypothetical protein